MLHSVILEDLHNIKKREISWNRLKDKTVLITGAYGMLASYMVYMIIFLNEEYGYNIKIIAMVRSVEKAKKRFGEYLNRDYFVLKTDPIDKPVIFDEDIDFIIHAASFASPQYYSVCPVDVAVPNVIGTYNLLELARKKQIEGMLLFSTGDVYGVVTDALSVTEKSLGVADTLDIHSCYSESKRMAETFCKCYCHQYNIPVMMARIFHTYGPTMDIENDPRVFSSFVRNIVNKEQIVMKSSGTQKRAFCYISDATAGFFKILLDGSAGEAYNVCNTKEYISIKEFADILVSLRPEYNLSVVRKERDINENYTENTTVGELPPNNEKLRSLGWEAEYSTEQGFDRVLKYMGV